METIKNAIIEDDGRIMCPVCKKCNGILNEGAVIQNFRILCRGSRRDRRHFFRLDWEGNIND